VDTKVPFNQEIASSSPGRRIFFSFCFSCFLSFFYIHMFFYTIMKLFITLLENVNKSRALLSIYLQLKFNPFTAEAAIMRFLGSAPKSHLCDQKSRSKVTGLSDLMTLFIDMGCLYCKQTQRVFNVFTNTLN
jgi:hypothetical protein